MQALGYCLPGAAVDHCQAVRVRSMDLYVTVLICVFLFAYVVILVVILCLHSYFPVSVLQYSAVCYQGLCHQGQRRGLAN